MQDFALAGSEQVVAILRAAGSNFACLIPYHHFADFHTEECLSFAYGANGLRRTAFRGILYPIALGPFFERAQPIQLAIRPCLS